MTPFVYVFQESNGLLSRKMSEQLDQWFQREVLAHEPVFLGYLRKVWPRREEIEDIAQESYARVYQAALANRPRSPRSFLYATARHLMADRIRRERIISIQAIGDLESLNVLVDELSAEHRVNAHQELMRLSDALDALPPRCREVVWLRRVEECSYREIAEQLGIGIKTVETHMTHGMQLLAAVYLKAVGATEEDRGQAQSAERDREQREP
jgi:RNA polymerase sigma factor (sigma-70 family)